MVAAGVGLAGAVTESTAMIISAVGYVVVDVAANCRAALFGAQGNTGAAAIAAFMVISAVDCAVMHMAAGKRTAFDRADRDAGLPILGPLSMTAASPPMMAGVRGSGGDQQEQRNGAYHTGK